MKTYEIPDYQPEFISAKENYRNAMSRLLKPFPSSPISAFPIFNKAIGGFRPREFSILCGATGVGKTTLAANWSASFLTDGIPHFVASVETGKDDFQIRTFCALSKKDLNTGEAVAVAEINEIHKQFGSLYAREVLTLSLKEDRFGVEYLMHEIELLVKSKGVKIAIIDNLNFFMDVVRSQDSIVEMDRVIHELIIFCKQVDVHLVMVMHPKKTENGRVESEFDIKGSSTAVQEAHNVFLFNKPHADMIKSGVAEDGDREIKIVKMRRRGSAVGTRHILGSVNSVHYYEKGIFK